MNPVFIPTRRGLYAITPDAMDFGTLEAITRRLLDAGLAVLQYRRKQTPADRRLAEALRLAALCRQAGTCFIVNDDPALARASAAAGVHLGREDPDPVAARRELGPGAIIGCSCYDSLQRARDAAAAGADYIAFGRFFPSRTKPQAVQAPLDLLGRARAEIGLPVVAIGGISPDNGARLLAAGADFLAVVEGLFSAPDPVEAARRYRRLFESVADPGPEENTP